MQGFCVLLICQLFANIAVYMKICLIGEDYFLCKTVIYMLSLQNPFSKFSVENDPLVSVVRLTEFCRLLMEILCENSLMGALCNAQLLQTTVDWTDFSALMATLSHTIAMFWWDWWNENTQYFDLQSTLLSQISSLAYDSWGIWWLRAIWRFCTISA